MFQVTICYKYHYIHHNSQHPGGYPLAIVESRDSTQLEWENRENAQKRVKIPDSSP